MSDPHGNRKCPVCGNGNVTAFVYEGAYATKWHYRCDMEHCGTTWHVIVEHPFTGYIHEPVTAR